MMLKQYIGSKVPLPVSERNDACPITCSSRVSLFCAPPAITADTPALALIEEASWLEWPVIMLFLSTVLM